MGRPCGLPIFVVVGIFVSRAASAIIASKLIMQQIENYIGGEMVQPASGEYLDNFDPSTGEIYSGIADSDDRDVNLAVEAAKAAFPTWSTVSAEDRHDAMTRIAALIERDMESLAKAESVDNGKPLSLARS